MKRFVVIFTLALLLFSAEQTQARCYAHYYSYHFRPVIAYRPYYHRAWIPVIGDGVGDSTSITGFRVIGTK